MMIEKSVIPEGEQYFYTAWYRMHPSQEWIQKVGSWESGELALASARHEVATVIDELTRNKVRAKVSIVDVVTPTIAVRAKRVRMSITVAATLMQPYTSTSADWTGEDDDVEWVGEDDDYEDDDDPEVENLIEGLTSGARMGHGDPHQEGEPGQAPQDGAREEGQQDPRIEAAQAQEIEEPEDA